MLILSGELLMYFSGKILLFSDLAFDAKVIVQKS